jgi:hypothetical protein
LKDSFRNVTCVFLSFRLIKHTKQLLEENEEKLCIKVLQTLREMMTKDRGYGEKVTAFYFHSETMLYY